MICLTRKNDKSHQIGLVASSLTNNKGDIEETSKLHLNTNIDLIPSRKDYIIMRGHGNKMRMLSPTQVAEIYGFSASQIRRLIKAGKIKAKKVGFFYAIEEKDVRNLKRRRALNKRDGTTLKE